MSKTPAEYFNKKIKGKLRTISLQVSWGENGETQSLPKDEYEFIEVIENERGKMYITNQWYKEYRQEPLMIVDSLVESIEEYD